MVVLILARELLVTSLRGITEAAGENFGAAFSGKLKMVLQSVTILVILVYVNNLPWLREHDFVQYATWFRNFCIWLMLAVTLFSGLLYVQRGVAIYVRSHHQKPQAFPPESQNG
jgi:CDP-diacylglycerol--glycerol-3-phosphate 3-phosphatidyltransferase